MGHDTHKARDLPSFADVKAVALAQIHTLAPRLVPGGAVKGQWYMARVPWREDRTPSLGISLTTGNFKDWGRGEGGTIIDLVMRLDNADAAAALAKLAGILGLSAAPNAPRRAALPAKPKPCAGCDYLWSRYAPGDTCTRVIDFFEEPVPIALARRSGWACGPQAKLYTPSPVSHAAE